MLAFPSESAFGQQGGTRQTPYQCGFCAAQGPPMTSPSTVSSVGSVTIFYCNNCKAILAVHP